MSVNPSRAEKTDGQLRKPGRSGNSGHHNHHRSYSGSGKGGSAGGSTGSSTAFPPSTSSSSAAASSPTSVSQYVSTGRSFKKAGGGPGGQSRVNPPSANSEASVSTTTNITRIPLQNGFTDAAASANPLNMPTPRSAPRPVPKAPSSQTAAGTSSNSASTVTTKGDASKQFTFQFGTINPGIVNGMQIPARTSSAPPNLDEQKRDQAQHESFRAIPTMPLSTAPKVPQQQETKKDVTTVSQSVSGGSQPPLPTKWDVPVPVPPAPAAAPPKPSVLPMPNPFQHQQHQVTMQFGSPNPQMQPPGLGANPLQMTMTLPVGSAPQVPQYLFPNVLQQQAMMHQGQGMGFAPQIGHQLAPQLGNLGMSLAHQFPQQQPGKIVGPRKTTVKITHPETHEELRLDKRIDSYKDVMSSGQRALSNVPPQPQPIATYTPSHQMNYYSSIQPNSYNSSPLLYPNPTSVPLTSSQMPASMQAPRYNYLSQSGQSIPFMNPTLSNAMPGGKPAHQAALHCFPEGINLEGLPVSSSPSAAVRVTAKPPMASQVEKVWAPSLTSSVTSSLSISKAETPNLLKPTIDVTPHQRQGVVAPDNQNEQQKPAESKLLSEPVKNISLPVSDGSSGDFTPALSTHKATPETSSSFSAPLMPEEDSGHVLAGNDEKKRESVRRSDSLKDNQKKASKKDPRNSQQQQHSEPSNAAESPNITSPKMDSSAGEESSTNLESIQLPLASNSASSAMSLSGRKFEEKISLEVGVYEAVENNASLASSGSFGRVLESKASEDTPPVSIDAISLPSDSAPVQETGLSEPSVSLDSVVVQNTDKESNANMGQDDTCIDAGRIENIPEVLSLGKTEVLNHMPGEFSDANVYPSSTLKESSEILDPIMPLEKGGIINSERVKLYETDESKEPGSTVVDICSLEEPERCKDQSLAIDADVASGTVPVLESDSSEMAEKPEVKLQESFTGGTVAAVSLVSKEKLLSESSKPKTVAGKKKKKKDICAKADAAGTSDLYNAYKGPEENHLVASNSEIEDRPMATTKNLVLVDVSEKEAVEIEEYGQNKTEVDDWEDAADISTAKLKVEPIQPLTGEVKQHDEVNEATSRKKYSKDFLLTFEYHFTELPIGFEIGSDLADALMRSPVGKSNVVDREPYPSPGRIIDRPSGASRVDRRIVEDDRWTRSPGSIAPGRDFRLDVAHGAAVVSLRPGPGANHRNMRALSSNYLTNGILPGPLQQLVSPAGVPRSNSDADSRWQRATGNQRGLISSPQTPLQIMHKAEKKYEVGKVTDEEQAKQRQLKAILNKLTPQNFEKLFAQVKEVNIDNAVTLTGVISQIFDKALMEPTFCEMYANFCVQLAGALPEISEDNEKITFRRLLLNKCQEEFERGEREQAEADKAEEEGEMKQSEEEREGKRIQARRRMLGNIRLIGELYKKKMLTEKIMHGCINKLLGQYQNPDEEDIECLCKLMTTIGEMIDHPRAKDFIDAYFNIMAKLSTNNKLSSRVRFMLKDVIDLRKNKWRQRRKVEGPKKIEELHRDAAQERHAQSSRVARGPSISSIPRRGPVSDYNVRGSSPLTPSSSHHGGGIRALPSQVRGQGSQDVRLDDRHQFESKTLSLPLPHRSTDDDSITLGPQGGLGRGMSIRGQPLMSTPPTALIASNMGDHRRVVSHQNGYNPPPDWTSNNSREDTSSRYVADRLSGANDQPNPQDHRVYGGNRDSRISDRAFDRPTTILPGGRTHVSSDNSQTLASVTKTFSPEVLREKSMSAIREFYSAKDDEELALCIKELNSPRFYPSMLSLWVTDSFERKDMERDLLAKLIVDLCRSGDHLVSQVQLIEGFEHVLGSLEDAVNDAPRAAEFLGRIFAKVIMENVTTLEDIGRLIHQGGEEPGRLRQIGLAAEVLGSIFESIRVEKGDSILNEIRASSNLPLEDFRPPQPRKSNKLEAFL